MTPDRMPTWSRAAVEPWAYLVWRAGGKSHACAPGRGWRHHETQRPRSPL